MALLVLALNLVPVWTEIYFYSQETNSFTVDAVLGSFCGVNLSVPANINLDPVLWMHSAILAMNVAEVVVKTIPLLQTTAPIPVIISALIPILISRFLLNLRNVGEAGSTMHDSLDSQFSAPEFHSPTWASIVGNMGEDLDHGTAEMEGWDDSDAAEETRARDAPSPERRSGAFITDNNDEVQEVRLSFFVISNTLLMASFQIL
ncbi:hypothetical protein PHLCEN_2v5784 [Hermanssonia centrifuga]|uniref:Uncharacterized protein n=1 Tax=Hermanssonia centrifuga TaxID=98765 RepID=A0A2R6P1D5_9APHY|nr:hypothetical protein PHLCEN_2v5784 [Hermanssonia centrifuga]